MSALSGEQLDVIEQCGREAERELQLADVYDRNGDWVSAADCFERAVDWSCVAFMVVRHG